MPQIIHLTTEIEPKPGFYEVGNMLVLVQSGEFGDAFLVGMAYFQKQFAGKAPVPELDLYEIIANRFSDSMTSDRQTAGFVAGLFSGAFRERGGFEICHIVGETPVPLAEE